jgi:hypothetical protein
MPRGVGEEGIVIGLCLGNEYRSYLKGGRWTLNVGSHVPTDRASIERIECANWTLERYAGQDGKHILLGVVD